MSRFLLASYDVLSEIGLWLMFATFAITGWYAMGFGGFLLGLIIAFLFATFLVAPFMMLSDLRKTTARIEKMAQGAIEKKG